jgi:hypothetical protein
MAALFQVTSLSQAPAEFEPASPRSDPPDVTAGLAYINRCLRGHRPFGILTGSARAMSALLARAAADMEAREDLHTVRITAPTNSVQVFLATCLTQLGFELFQAGLDDLHNLLVVFLRHEGARGRRTVAIIETTENCGPRVLEFMQTLSKVRAGTTPAITFLLTGSRDLHRVLDSQGMAGLRHFTRERFDLDRALAWVTPINKPASLLPAGLVRHRNEPASAVVSELAPGSIVLLLDGAIVGRRKLAPGKLVIGRSPQSALRLDSRYVSRQHAVLVITANSVTVVDLQSTNGTLVNGQPTTSQQLEHGDLLAIGNFRLRYDCRPGQRAIRES